MSAYDRMRGSETTMLARNLALVCKLEDPEDASDSLRNVRIARDEAIGGDDQGTTDPACIRERKGLRKHANTNQKGGGIEKLGFMVRYFRRKIEGGLTVWQKVLCPKLGPITSGVVGTLPD